MSTDTGMPITPGLPRRLYVDAAALVGTAGLTAVIGLVFWAFAARLIPPEQLGIDTALVSLMTAAASVCATGPGNAFTALLPVSRASASERLRQGYLMVIGASCVVGLLAGFAAATFLQPRVGVGPAVVVGGSVVVWSLFVVQDPALTGLGRATLLPWENIAVSVLKLSMLPLLVGAASHPVLLATVAPSALAVLVISGLVVPRLAPRGGRLAAPPAEPTTPVERRREHPAADAAAMRGFAVRDGLGSAFGFGVVLLLPFLVTAVAGPTEGAVFGISLAIAQGLDLVSAGTGTSLTVHSASRPRDAMSMAFAIWKRVAVLVVVGAIALCALSPFFLDLLGPSYVERGGVAVIAFFAATSVLRTAFIVWESMLRALRRTALLLRVNIAVACTVLPLVIVGAHRWGAVGAAGGFAVAQLLITSCVATHVVAQRRSRR